MTMICEQGEAKDADDDRGRKRPKEEDCGAQQGVSREAQDDSAHEEDCDNAIGMGCGVRRDGVKKGVCRVCDVVNDCHC